jgi:hypothetical protein
LGHMRGVVFGRAVGHEVFWGLLLTSRLWLTGFSTGFVEPDAVILAN